MPSTAPLRSTRQIAATFVLALVCAGFEENGFEVFIPYVPTPQAIVERMLELAEVGERDYLIDLGSGDGRIPITAARKHGARALGVEIKPELVRLADRHAADAGVSDKVSFREQDLFKTPISEATVIALYLPPSINLKLRPRLLDELRPGSRVVSQSYNMGGWHADARAQVRGIDVYLWIVPARVAGRWILRDGSREITLAISQEFQEIKGGATVGARSLPLLDADLRGDRIEFALDLGDAKPTRFRGRVAGDVMEQDETNATSLWRATRDTGVKSR
jgi:precorrin-6B methylase 2